MVEDLSAGVRDLYADAEHRLLGIVARQFADGFEAPAAHGGHGPACQNSQQPRITSRPGWFRSSPETSGSELASQVR